MTDQTVGSEKNFQKRFKKIFPRENFWLDLLINNPNDKLY